MVNEISQLVFTNLQARMYVSLYGVQNLGRIKIINATKRACKGKMTCLDLEYIYILKSRVHRIYHFSTRFLTQHV